MAVRLVNILEYIVEKDASYNIGATVWEESPGCLTRSLNGSSVVGIAGKTRSSGKN
jgi:hypothetical protein